MASLQEVQQALARRLTLGGSEATSDDERQLLMAFDPDELEHSRETLIRKRLSQIASLLPGTRLALQHDYERLGRTFIDRHHFQGYRAPQLDATHFASWLITQPEVAVWQTEVAGWEGSRIAWLSSRWLVRIKGFRYRKGNLTMDGIKPVQQRSVWIWMRLAGWGRMMRLL